ncbi:peptidase M15 [Kouleothrix aurantiaca]|uniref:Peptidase M15 n=1 Tax=Kouleothrix aurantiaca TaxID=186479 RepID=A0A0P9DBI5_9CHLR|nr:peptidase M15 [Kouleothrix aurantiaca]
MTYRKQAQTTASRICGVLIVGMLLVVMALGHRLLAPTSSTAAPAIDIPRSEQPQPQPAPQPVLGKDAPPGSMPRLERRSALSEADGAVPEGTTILDDDIPGVAKLRPALLAALREAAADAADDGVTFFVTSGWRSSAYQNQLLREAISEYGSEAEAARWVASAETSPHVSGDAIDIGHADAMAWLSERGAAYGLCQLYGNEPWHYELRPAAIAHGCPPLYADPTHDPRMQR